MAQDTNTPTLSDRVNAIKAIAKINTTEKANKYDSNYFKLSYGIYSLYGTYKAKFKLAKNKLNDNGTTKNEKELKDDNFSSAMYKLISNNKDYKLIFSDDYAKFSYYAYKLSMLSDSLAKAKSEKEKTEKEKELTELLNITEQLRDNAKKVFDNVNKELSEKLKS